MKEFDFDSVGKRLPYATPEGFFERAKMQAKSLDAGAQGLHRRRTFIVTRVEIAAAVVLAVCGAAWWAWDYNSLENRYERMLAECSTDVLWEFAYEYDSDSDKTYFY